MNFTILITLSDDGQLASLHASHPDLPHDITFAFRVWDKPGMAGALANRLRARVVGTGLPGELVLDGDVAAALCAARSMHATTSTSTAAEVVAKVARGRVSDDTDDLCKVSPEVVVDDELRGLLPPLSPEELSELEASIVAVGVRDPLVVWETERGLVLVDGHHRRDICDRFDLPFEVRRMEFGSRSDVIEWMVRTQFARRNLTPMQRCELALRLKEVLAARAKENQRAAGGALSQNLGEALDTARELAKVAGVSHETIRKAERIAEAAKAGQLDPAKLEDVRQGRRSIHGVHQSLGRKKNRPKAKPARPKVLPEGEFGIVHGDLNEIAKAIPDASIALVIYDPPKLPYSMDVYRALGKAAGRVLTNRGSLVAHVCGDRVIDAGRALEESGLGFNWTIGIQDAGAKLEMKDHGISVRLRQMLWFVKWDDCSRLDVPLDDLVVVPRGTTDPSLEVARYFVEKLTAPGDLVLIPACGTGAIPVACKQLGRRWLAFDSDAGRVEAARARLAKVVQP